MNVLERLMLEAIPGPRLPYFDCGDGPTARMMAVERQRALWALAHDNDVTASCRFPSEGRTA